MTPAHTGEGGRIVSRHVLRKVGCLGCETEAWHPGTGERTACSHGNSIQKIPAGDGAAYAQFSIAGAVGFVVVHEVLGLWSFSFPRGYDFRNRAMPLINSDVGIGVAISVGIGNVDTPEWLSPDHTRAL